jgi:hypothetical protein
MSLRRLLPFLVRPTRICLIFVIGACAAAMAGAESWFLGLRATNGQSSMCLEMCDARVYVTTYQDSFSPRRAWHLKSLCGVGPYGSGRLAMLHDFAVPPPKISFRACSFYVPGTLLCAAALGGFVALRPRKRASQVCSSCSYSLTGLRGARCPECGATIPVGDPA